LSGNLPKHVCDIYQDSCDLFNLTGNSNGTTMAVDLDHLGKRFCSRLKSLLGIAIGNFTFDKVLLAAYLGMSGVVESAREANRLLNPEDSMDVLEMVRGLQAVAGIGNVPYAAFPAHFCNKVGSRPEYKAVQLLSQVSKLMCILIIGQEGAFDKEEKDHLSIETLLICASKLSHMLFFLFESVGQSLSVRSIIVTGKIRSRTSMLLSQLLRMKELMRCGGSSTQLRDWSNFLAY